MTYSGYHIDADGLPSSNEPMVTTKDRIDFAKDTFSLPDLIDLARELNASVASFKEEGGLLSGLGQMLDNLLEAALAYGAAKSGVPPMAAVGVGAAAAGFRGYYDLDGLFERLAEAIKQQNVEESEKLAKEIQEEIERQVNEINQKEAARWKEIAEEKFWDDHYGNDGREDHSWDRDPNVTAGPGEKGPQRTCFGAGTLVLMGDGSKKPIERIEMGDRVMAYGRDGVLSPAKVVQLFAHEGGVLYDLDGLLATGNHPFLTAEGRFKELKDIATGALVVAANGELVALPERHHIPGFHTTYNFAVEKYHTYIVFPPNGGGVGLIGREVDKADELPDAAGIPLAHMLHREKGSIGGYRVHNKDVAPIVLDLNGDGRVELTSIEDSAAFIDILGSGFKHHAGWVGPNDGLLAVDLDGDGKITKTLEWAFANQTADVAGDTDLEALASLYDSNRDGVLDHKDEAWLKFYVWRDANGNGVVDEGEVKSLSEWGVTSIKLTSDGQGQDAQGNWISGYGTYSKGETQFNIFADVGLAVSDIGYKVTQAANGQIVEFKAEDVELGPNPANDSLRTYKMFQASDLPLSMNLTQEGLAYDIVVGGKGDDVIGVENAGAGIYAAVDQEGTKAKQDYLAKAIAEITFRLNLATDQATKDSLSTQLTQVKAEALIPVYLGYVLSGGEGNDQLTGGRGDDWISGDAGIDIIKGADGDDILFIDSLDSVEGGKGHDIAFLMDKGFDQAHELNMGGQSLETVIGGEGNDWVKAGTPLDGGKAGIIIDGGNGDDYLTGGEYNDQLSGGAGIDTLLGGRAMIRSSPMRKM